MVFSSTLFLFLFLPLTLMIYYNPFVRSRKFRNRCLLVASLFFYAWGEPFFVWLMVLPIAVGWACGRAMERAASRRQEKRILTAGVVFHVGLLFVFQYLMFAASQLGLLLHEDFSAIHIALPIGISFFTFQLLSYLFDIYYGRSKAQQSVLAVGLYIALFPQLIAGPIVRYETIEQQIEHRVENIADFSSGMMRFIYGLGKKVVIANYMGVVADNIFDGAAASRSRRPGMARLPIRCRFTLFFRVQRYGDRSRTHVRVPLHGELQLSVYLAERDGVLAAVAYLPRHLVPRLCLYPAGRQPGHAAALGVQSLRCLGAHGHLARCELDVLLLGPLVLRAAARGETHRLPRETGPLAHVYALLAIVLGWTVFRAKDLGAAVSYIGAMLGMAPGGIADATFSYYLTNSFSVFAAAVLLSLPIVPYLQRKAAFQRVEPVLATGIFVLSLVLTVSSSYNPFIYFNF